MTPALATATTALLVAANPVALGYATHGNAVQFPASQVAPAKFRAERLTPTGIDWVDKQLIRLAGLPKDWDGYNADPIALDRLNILGALLKANLPVGAPVGNIVPGADGSVQAEWHRTDASFGLLVEDGGRVSDWRFANDDQVETEVEGQRAAFLLKSAVIQTLA